MRAKVTVLVFSSNIDVIPLKMKTKTFYALNFVPHGRHALDLVNQDLDVLTGYGRRIYIQFIVQGG